MCYVFAGDADYICVGSHRQHQLYVWDKTTGNVVKMLTGPKGESLLDLTWHPVRPIILSVSNGVVNIWSHTQTELWSAYAPNFKEFNENEEYEERESEFDIEDEDKSVEGDKGSKVTEEQLEVNIIDPPKIMAFCSSEEDSEEPLDWLPNAEIDDPEEAGWGQLEPTLNDLPNLATPTKRSCTTDNENIDPSLAPPTNKEPRTIAIELPEANGVSDKNKL